MDESLRELSRLSARVGADPQLVQGAGGNSSLKQANTLWVKASGTWLRDAEQDSIFVPISLSEARALCGPEGAADDSAWKALRPLDGNSLAPSIETPLHALLDSPVVFHVHSIRTIAWAVRQDSAARLAERLEGLAWSLIPYARPGTPLADAVAEALRAQPGSDVLILANHGLVLGGESVTQVEERLAEVEDRLAAGLPEVSAPTRAIDAGAPAPPSGFAWSEEPWTHSASLSGAALDVAAAGTLYPDHVVFLGPRARVIESADAIPTESDAKILFVRGVGTLVRRDLTPGALAMAECLGRVLAHLPTDAPVRYLSADDEAELLGWDAEKYRGHLDRMRRDAQTQ